MAVTKKDLESLKAVAAALGDEKARLETRIREAWGNYYQAEREFQRNEKPTPAMLTALVALSQEGARLIDYDHITNCRHSCWVEDAEKSHVLDVRESVFYGLKSREAIGGEVRDGVFRRAYEISSHGRDILARRSTNAPKQDAESKPETSSVPA